MTMKRLLCSLLVLVSGFGGGHLFFVVDALSSVLTPTLGRSTTPTTSQRSSTDTKDQTQQHCPLLDEWREYDLFRGSNLETEELEPFFKARPLVIVNRLLQVSTTLWQARRDWEATAPAADGDTNIFADTDKEKGMVVDTRSERENQLCAAISSLGPVAVKVGQTLSQRPDIVGHEACKALVRLQTKNLPYDNDLAYAVIRESLNWEGPIAPGIGADLPGQPLFANMTADPVACASLGQVYKAETWEGQFVAVKVQRPDAMAVLAKDLQCFRTVFKVREQVQLLLGGQSSATANSKQNVGSVIDRVGRDILDEIDYTIEAANSAEFRESLAFLGFVTTPDFVPKYSSKRVLVTEWIAGNHLEYLDKTNGLAMTRMAVEACTASMVLTGLGKLSGRPRFVSLDCLLSTE
jgi:predicted unusual protein kinase regulating ubiquinone biosynthesis (AarF/ABC1/UbiB family)